MVRADSKSPAATGGVPRISESPHFRKDRCQACHPKDSTKRISSPTIDGLCLSCHAGKAQMVEVHPSNIKAFRGEVRKISRDFPLDGGKVSCRTCHDIPKQCAPAETGPGIDRMFLRGGPYMNPWDVCYACHESSLYEVFNPHNQIDGEGKRLNESCSYCHAPPGSASANSGGVGAADDRICKTCHMKVFHPAGTFHMRAPLKEERATMVRVTSENNLYFPLDSRGEIYCSTCHNPHEEGVLPKDRPSARGAEGDEPKASRLRVRKKEICFVCHGFRPFVADPPSKSQ